LNGGRKYFRRALVMGAGLAYYSAPRFRTRPPREQAVPEVGKFGSESEKVVDRGKKILHNLVSLLLMQRRRTEGVVAVVKLLNFEGD
jgi:hypothetical protein